jgi:hypothetical protein
VELLFTGIPSFISFFLRTLYAYCEAMSVYFVALLSVFVDTPNTGVVDERVVIAVDDDDDDCVADGFIPFTSST